MSDSPVYRPAARVLLLNGADRIFLFHYRLESAETGSIWVPPGGGLNEGESYEEAALRELWEETGLQDVTLSSRVWLRSHKAEFSGVVYDVLENYFVCRVNKHDPGAHVNPDEVERASLLGSEWWSLEELQVSKEVFVPRRLGELLPPLIRGEFPAKPIEIGA